MDENASHSVSTDDRILLTALNTLAEHNGLAEFGPGFLPPKFTVPDYIPPKAGTTFLITNIVLLLVTCFMMAGRFYTKFYVIGGLGGDDVAIGIAMVYLHTLVACPRRC